LCKKKRFKASFNNEEEAVEEFVYKIDGVMTKRCKTSLNNEEEASVVVLLEQDIEKSRIEIKQKNSLFVGNDDDFC